MVRSIVSQVAGAFLSLALAGCGSAPGTNEEALALDDSSASSEDALSSSLLDIVTVSQGGRGSDHAHHCYLAACTTIFNYLTTSPITMDQAWARTGQTMPARDRVRATFTGIGLPLASGYMAAVSYTASATQLKAIGTSIANGWPVMLGIGAKSASAAEIGHYIVIGGVDSTLNPTKFVLLDPWNAPVNDRGVMVPAPKAGAPVTGLRASRSWVGLEVYFAKNYKTKRAI